MAAVLNLEQSRPNRRAGAVSRLRTPAQLLLLAGTQATTQLASFLALLLVAHSLSLANYGIYSVAITTSFFVAALPGIGIDLAVIRFTAHREGPESNSLIVMGALVKIAASAVVTLLALALSGVLAANIMGQPEAANALRIGAISGFIAGSTAYVFAVLQSRHRFGLLATVSLFGAAAKILPVAVLASLGMLTLNTAYSTFVIPALVVLVGGGMLAGLHRMSIKDIDVTGGGRLVKTSAWLTLGILANSVMVFIDVYMIAAMKGASEAGLYSGARVIAMGLYVFGAAALAVLLPKAIRLEGASQLASFTRRALCGMAVLAAPLLVVPLAAQPLVEVLLPGEFNSAALTLRLLSMAFIVELFVTPLVVLLIALDASRAYALSSLAVLPVALVALVFGVAQAGAAGAASVFLAHRLAFCTLLAIAAIQSLRARSVVEHRLELELVAAR